MRSLIFQTVAPIALHLILVFSAFLLFMGHNQPGGGFIAGLMTSVGLILQFMAFGRRYGLERFPWPFDRVYPLGLAVAGGVGLAGLAFGAFLKSRQFHLTLPLLGGVEVLTAFLFDVGVYFVVVGMTMAVLLLLSER
ncbi:MAG: MnhB domain-containing protein [Nitrospinota bacterium]